jgi:coenzyme F420 hydrogenase subunit beta
LEESAGKIAFVGKPCDVAAISGYLRLYPEFNEKVGCLISFFCAGTSSIKATEAAIEQMGVDIDDISSLSYRGHGWPGKMTALTTSGEEQTLGYEVSWGKILNRHLHFRCRICADAIGELADIVCADAWHLKDGKPDIANKEGRAGRSLVLSRTSRGGAIVSAAQSAGYLDLESYDESFISMIQPFQARRRRRVSGSLQALRLSGFAATRYQGFRFPGLRSLLLPGEPLDAFERMVTRLAKSHKTTRVIFLKMAVRFYRRLLGLVYFLGKRFQSSQTDG